MAYTVYTVPSKKVPGKFIGLVKASSRINSAVMHKTERKDTKAEAYAAAVAWRDANAEANAARKASKDEARMTCQCCGRAHLANTGFMAHHGYQRPGGGWQTASCAGARHLPFEVSRDTLGKVIASLTEQREGMIASLAAAEAETIAFRVTVRDTTQPKTMNQRTRRMEHPDVTVEVTRNDFGNDERVTRRYHSFDEIKSANISHRKMKISQITDYINDCQTRYDGWKQTHSHFDKASKTWVAI